MKEMKLKVKKIFNEVDLGNVEFAPSRTDIDPEDREEENTPEEQELWDSMLYWVNDSQQPMDAQWNTLVDAMKDPRYKDFFRIVSGSKKLYRGMSVPGATLAGWLGISEDELSKTPKGSRDGDWTIAPKYKENMFVSYTRKKATAWRFAESFADDHPYSVIFHAFVSNNQGVFLDIESMLGRIEQSHLDVDPEDEAEKAALGPVKVSCIEWRLV